MEIVLYRVAVATKSIIEKNLLLRYMVENVKEIQKLKKNVTCMSAQVFLIV